MLGLGVNESVDETGAAEVTVTSVGATLHGDMPDGSPMHRSLSVPVNPPLGVIVHGVDPVVPGTTVKAVHERA